ncbi:MAG: SGNH/GDSL hydrolase family protein [Planctomycetota bacterium]
MWRVFSKLALSAGAAALTVLATVLAIKATMALAGLRDQAFRYENQIGMWGLHPRLGFANKTSFSAVCFGTVSVETDARGYRKPSRTSPASQPSECLIGIGDSVMWGTGTDEADSFLGLLREPLASRSPPLRLINAGVVGFATYQERLLLEHDILPLDPAIVLLNYGINDILPTEDPFGSVRAIYDSYVARLLQDENQGSFANPGDREQLAALRDALNRPDEIWPWLEKLPPPAYDALARYLVDKPLLEMASLCRANGIRFILLLIPPRDPDERFGRQVKRVRATLDRQRIEYLDLTAELTPPLTPEPRERRAVSWLRFLRRTPLRGIEALMQWRELEHRQEHELFLDHCHPTRRGNRIIAAAILRYLESHSGGWR